MGMSDEDIQKAVKSAKELKSFSNSKRKDGGSGESPSSVKVLPLGIEPGPTEPESVILSFKLREQFTGTQSYKK